MTITLNPYLNFRGTAREAMEFYQSVFGGELRMNTFGEFGMPVEPSETDLIMHAQLEAPGGLVLMGADATAQHSFADGPARYAVSLSGDDAETLTGYWRALSDGASVEQALAQAPWGDSFGSLTDRFGIAWLVNIRGGTAQ